VVLECEVGVSERGFFGGDVDGSILGFLSGGESTSSSLTSGGFSTGFHSAAASTITSSTSRSRLQQEGDIHVHVCEKSE
jgi:hypothetical protein